MKLKVGDRVYIKDQGKISEVVTITKATSSVAYSDNYEFKSDVYGGEVKIKGLRPWEFKVGLIETEELKKQFNS
jgi:hypothetical protein